MAKIVVDPITRIEGHLRIEAVVENGKITVADEAEIVASARASSERVWKRFPESDLQGRSLGAAFPPTYTDWAERTR